MERTFFFLGFCPPSIRAVWHYFLGERIWQNLGQLLFLNFVRAEEGSGEESARASEFFGERR
uniref:Uncharacterized protein n=1 Tax=Candidatus Giovannonibacteria bacterium GW2011_GWF2_42_19 TaxID=1618659 RepID=A0A0G1BL00_9BACT|nr:MAG: hypothetical protein UV11_C0021G0002 [Candidatus Giovannonibacteria bacterium GW2011_GWF2_42_19]